MSVSWPSLYSASAHSLRSSLPPDLRAFHWKATHHMAKAWYGNTALHYEIWVRPRLRVVELGLHFEADALTNARLLAAFRARGGDVERALGADARLEEWDRGWARVWEPIPLELPDGVLATRIPSRLVDYVRVLEPILRDELPADVAWSLPATAGHRRPRASAVRTRGRAAPARSTSSRTPR